MARLYTVPPARGAPSAGTYVSFVADYDGLDVGGAEACNLSPTYPYTALFCRLRPLFRFLFFYHVSCIVQRGKMFLKFIIFIE